VTQPSESKTRSVAAIGDGCVIPAQAGIQCFTPKPKDPGFLLSRKRLRHPFGKLRAGSESRSDEGSAFLGFDAPHLAQSGAELATIAAPSW